MAWRFALLVHPLSAEDPRDVVDSGFTEISPQAPALPVGELSAQRGDGVFESIGVIDGHPQEVEAHLRRLAHSAELCDLPAPHLGQWRAAVARAARACGPGEAVIKLVLSRGVDGGPAPTAWVMAGTTSDFTAARADGIRVATLDRGYAIDTPARAPWLLLGAKTLSYAVNMAAIREAVRRGADDAVFVSSDGYLLEAPTASVVLRRGDSIVTPTPQAGILHGTTQLSLFAHLSAEGYSTSYATVPATDLVTADAAWLVSSVRLAAPIVSVDEREIAVDAELTASMNAYLLSPRD